MYLCNTGNQVSQGCSDMFSDDEKTQGLTIKKAFDKMSSEGSYFLSTCVQYPTVFDYDESITSGVNIKYKLYWGGMRVDKGLPMPIQSRPVKITKEFDTSKSVFTIENDVHFARIQLDVLCNLGENSVFLLKAPAVQEELNPEGLRANEVDEPEVEQTTYTLKLEYCEVNYTYASNKVFTIEAGTLDLEKVKLITVTSRLGILYPITDLITEVFESKKGKLVPKSS